MNIKDNPPVDFKPFNLEHAKAGVPVGLSDGRSCRILCFDRKEDRDDRCIILLIKDTIYQREHVIDATNTGIVCCNGGDLVMLPLGYIEDRPVFVGDVVQWNIDKIDSKWHDMMVGYGWSSDDGTSAIWRFKPQKIKKEVWQMLITESSGAAFYLPNGFSSEKALVDATLQYKTGCTYTPVCVSQYEVDQP